MQTQAARARADIAVVTNRRLESLQSGSTALLLVLFEEMRAAALTPALVCAPTTAFGNRPWAKIHPAFRGAGVIWPRTARLGDLYLSAAPSVWARFAVRALKEIGRRLGLAIAIGTNLADEPGERELTALAAAVEATGAQAALVEYTSLGPLLGRLTALPHRFLLLHDLFSLRSASFEASGQTAGMIEVTLAEEAARCAHATAIFYVSETERAALAPLLARTAFCWLKPTLDARRDALVSRDPFVCFIGANHGGNQDALAHLLGEIWPLVIAAEPTAELVIAGEIGRAVQGKPAGVRVTGPVEDLAQFAGPDAIGAAPIRVGSGLPIKVGEYMSLGMPVVAYASGVASYGDRLDGAIVSVDTPEAFADALLALLRAPDLRRRASAEALDRLEAIAAEDSVRAALESAAPRQAR